MDCKSLMIGDLVKLKTDNDDLVPCKIGELSGMLFVLIDGDEIMDVISYDDVEPIPLTEDILEANGWKWRKKGLISSMRLFDEDGHSIMTLTYGNLMSIGGHEIKVQYVHELQRALRCCGLFDLADNFKIE